MSYKAEKPTDMVLEQEYQILKDRFVSLLGRREKHGYVDSKNASFPHFTEQHRSSSGRPVRYEFNGWLERSVQRRTINSLAKR